MAYNAGFPAVLKKLKFLIWRMLMLIFFLLNGFVNSWETTGEWRLLKSSQVQ